MRIRDLDGGVRFRRLLQLLIQQEARLRILQRGGLHQRRTAREQPVGER